jgi:hypothetical protein
MMKLTLIRHSVPKAARGRNEACKRFFAEFPFLKSILIDAYRSQERDFSCVTKLQQPIQVPLGTIHLVPSPRPFDPARLG